MLNIHPLLQRHTRWLVVKSTKNIFFFFFFIIRKHNKDTHNKLRKLKSKFPKQFWKILNSIENKKRKQGYQYKRFIHFFKDTSSHNGSPDPDGVNINLLIASDNDILNSHITENEISKGIKNLEKTI